MTLFLCLISFSLHCSTCYITSMPRFGIILNILNSLLFLPSFPCLFLFLFFFLSFLLLHGIRIHTAAQFRILTLFLLLFAFIFLTCSHAIPGVSSLFQLLHFSQFFSFFLENLNRSCLIFVSRAAIHSLIFHCLFSLHTSSAN